MIKMLVHRFGRWYIQELCKREYGRRRFSHNEKTIEYRFVLNQLAALCPIEILDVASGMTAFPQLLQDCGYKVTAIDKIVDYWPEESFLNRHFHVIRDDITAPKLSGTFDVVICNTALQGMPDSHTAVASMTRLLNAAGTLIMTFPYNEVEYLANVYEHPQASYGRGLPYVGQVFSRNELDRWARANGITLVNQEWWRCFSGNYWACGERLFPPRPASVKEPHDFTCVSFLKDEPVP